MTAATALHKPVMLREVLAALNVRPGGRYVDGTVGGGGHADAIMEAASPGGTLLGIDKDPRGARARARAPRTLRRRRAAGAGRLRRDGRICRELGFAPVHGVLLDLGLSSLQLEEPSAASASSEKGRWTCGSTRSQELTAAEIVNEYDERDARRHLCSASAKSRRRVASRGASSSGGRSARQPS